MKTNVTIGIDCGVNGAMCALGISPTPLFCRLNKDAINMLEKQTLYGLGDTRVFIEHIDSQKRFVKANIHSMRLLSEGYGYWRGVLDALRYKYEIVPASTWQSIFGIGGRGRGRKYDYTERKNTLWEKAVKLYPDVKVHKYACDALLIAHYGTYRT